jgi:hypothetical protein
MTDLIGFHPPLVRKGIFKGVNLAALVERLWRLEAMRVDARCSTPEIRWHAHRFGSGAWGNAHVVFRVINLRLDPSGLIEDAVHTLLHELVHCACPPKEHHGELFCRRLIACSREAFGIDLDTAALLDLPAVQGKRAYAIDHAIIATMQAAGVGAHLRADPLYRFEPPPVETEEQIAVRRGAKLAERLATKQAHARAMLEQWERKLAAAKKRATKWRVKVRYYDRRQEAAKRRGDVAQVPRDAEGGGVDP